MRHLVSIAGSGRFATATAQGPNRAAEIVDALSHAQILADGTGPVRAILCGVLAGDDLRLSELSVISKGVRATFGEQCAFNLATVNDEATFSGRVSVVLMLFERGENDTDKIAPAVTNTRRSKARRNGKSVLAVGPTGRGRFNNAEPTTWHDQDLDIPTFIRENISLDL